MFFITLLAAHARAVLRGRHTHELGLDHDDMPISRQAHAHAHAPELLEMDALSREKERVIDTLLDLGSMKSENLQRAITQATVSFSNFTKLKLPENIQEALVALTKGDVKLDEASILKARGVLNDMISTAQDELDTKILQCKVWKSKNRMIWGQVSTDLSRLGGQIADLRRSATESESEIQRSSNMISMIKETMDAHKTEYDKIRALDEKEMKWRQSDLRVAEFILRLTKCKADGKSFLEYDSAPMIRHCDDGTQPGLPSKAGVPKEETKKAAVEKKVETKQMSTLVKKRETKITKKKTKTNTTFVNRFLHSAMDRLTWVGRKILEGVLMQSKPVMFMEEEQAALLEEDRPTNGLEAPSKGKSTPASARKQANKCSLGKPNCGLLHDNMSLMWGEMKDEVDELEAKMNREERQWTAKNENWNDQIRLLADSKNNHAQGLAEATSNLNADMEEQEKKEQEERRLQKEFKVGWAACKKEMDDILFTKICGVKKVRGELHKNSKDVKPDDIIDCDVGDWIEEDCSVACDDTLKGGLQNLKREVTTQANANGVVCPRLEETIKCNQIPCPVDCHMSQWSRWGTCSKECGGGVQTRSRDIEMVPSNGGLFCDAKTDQNVCNVDSCDRNCVLKNWKVRPCSVACGGGWMVRKKHVKQSSRGNGKCPKKRSFRRYAKKRCNRHKCFGDEECLAKQDIIFALDGSGSVREEGFEILKNFTAHIAQQFRGKVEEVDEDGNLKEVSAAQIAAVQFGNGVLNKDNTVSSAEIVHPLTSDIQVIADRFRGLSWQRGFTNMAQAFSAASNIFLNGGRKNAQSVLILITDGKPSFLFSTQTAVKKLRRSGVKVVIVAVKEFPGKELEEMKKFASVPRATNFVHIPGLQKLKERLPEFANEVLIHSCPKTISQRQEQEWEERLRKQAEMDDFLKSDTNEEATEDSGATAQ